MHIKSLLLGTRRVALTALLLGICSFGNAQNIENQIIASQFGQFKLFGVNNSFNFPPASCQLSAGNKNFVAFQQGVPVRIVDTGTPSLTETVTAGPVSIETCAVALPATQYHGAFYLTSGTAGLQEAINANGPGAGPNTVILDNAWYALGGGSSIISSVKGFSNLGLVDITQTPYVWYSWNGSRYVETPTGGDVASVFGRQGVVVAQSGDYNCGQVTGCGVAPNIAFNSQLASSISSSATTIPLSNSTALLTVPGVVVIDSEWIQYTGVSGDNLTGATRGYHQTTAASHSSGAYAYSVLLDFGNPSQPPVYAMIANRSGLTWGAVFGCGTPDPISDVLQIGCPGNDTYFDGSGGIHQIGGSTGNNFQSPVAIGPGDGLASITNSGYLFDSTRQNNSTVTQGFGAGITPIVAAVQPPTIAAPTITNLAGTGSTTWSYECTGTDVDGNTFPGTVATITNGPASVPEGDGIIVSCPYSSGAVTESIWRTAGPGTTGFLITAAMPASVEDTGGSTPGTPPSTNSSVPKVCTGAEQYCQLSGTTSTPTVACSSATQGWTFHNVSATVSPFAYVCNGTSWVTAY